MTRVERVGAKMKANQTVLMLPHYCFRRIECVLEANPVHSRVADIMRVAHSS